MKKLQKLYTCMGCGFKTLNEVLSEYEDCAICDWEDRSTLMYDPFYYEGNGKSLIGYQKEYLKKIPYKIKKYKVGNKTYVRSILWKPIDESKLSKIHNYFPAWKFGEFISKYPKYGKNQRKTMKEAQKHNPDDKVHMTNEEIIQKGLW